MTESEVRELIVESFETAGVSGFQYNDYKWKFMENLIDIEFSQLDIDSLAAMEVCIAIELNTGISIVPAEFINMGTMNKLVSTIMESKV